MQSPEEADLRIRLERAERERDEQQALLIALKDRGQVLKNNTAKFYKFAEENKEPLDEEESRDFNIRLD